MKIQPKSEIIRRLQELKAHEKLIGFCPWQDGNGMLWGNVIEVKKTVVKFRLIDPLGKFYEECSYRLSRILYLEEDELYAERLRKLASFQPTLPDKPNKLKKRSEIQNALDEASRTGEVIRFLFTGEQYINTGTITELGEEWVTFQTYDDLIQLDRILTIQRRAIQELRWREAKCEADGFLLRL